MSPHPRSTDCPDEQVEQLRQRDDVQRALRQATGRPRTIGNAVVPARHKRRLALYLLLLVVLSVGSYVLRLQLFDIPGRWEPLLRRAMIGGMAMVLVMGLAELVEAVAVQQVVDSATRYNLKRIVRLLLYLVLATIVLSVLFANWYAAFASLGLISLVLGFALQTPITSVIGWLYILVREPYGVGDRICIGNAIGDVIDVSYFDTTLWEAPAASDGPSGRIVKFPNANVLTSAVFNYSWPAFPYVWNEIPLQVGYDSDLEFVARTMQAAAEEILGEAMIERARAFREILAHTPVDEVQINERPTVNFRVSQNTWIEAVVRYIVEPTRVREVRSQILALMLARLNREPERVRFPKGDSR